MRKAKNNIFAINKLVTIVFLAILLFCGCGYTDKSEAIGNQANTISINSIPDYCGSDYIELLDNQPTFTNEEKGCVDPFETYSDLDNLGRCGVAYANICLDIMPTEKRGEIGQIKPTGWVQEKYPGLVNSSPPYLYNRCHLIAYQLAGENANEKNLITGTRYFNAEIMLPFENMVAEYVNETYNHVLYRVTPFFEGDNLLCNGVQMEAWSIEDSGEGICFNVFCYNIQPGIVLDYATGESQIGNSVVAHNSPVNEAIDNTYDSIEYDYVLNTNTMKFHYPNCSSVSDMKEMNKDFFTGSRDELLAKGYSPCGRCEP